MSIRRFRSFSSLALAATLLLAPIAAPAADDPSIQGELRRQIQSAMAEFIADQTHGGVFSHFDPVSGDLLALSLKKLHSGIVKKGDYYVSCADFLTADGDKVDIDFLVLATGNGPHVQQAVVHKRDGKKRPYHLER